MTEKEMIQFIAGASGAAGELLDAEPDVFQISKTPTRSLGYYQRLPFGRRNSCLGIRKSAAPNYLLNLFVDVAAGRIEADRFSMEASPGGLFIPSIARPCLPEEWGADLYRDVQNRVIQSFSYGVSLDMALISHLSAQRYEGAKCEGGLAFDSGRTADVDALLSMSVDAAAEIAFEPAMLRQIRKLLAGARDSFLVFRWDPGLGKYICRGYCGKDAAAQLEWRVLFTDFLDWKFFHYSHPMFRFHHEDIKVIRDPISAVLEDLRKKFGPSFRCGAARPLLGRGSEQSHGTALIFLNFKDPYIARWIDRLYQNRRAIRLTSCLSMPDAVQSLSGMDGALLIDARSLEVRYFTAIVDGRVSSPGDLSRGARHNSIHTFLSDLVRSSPRCASKAVAVVFSEDGGAVTIKWDD